MFCGLDWNMLLTLPFFEHTGKTVLPQEDLIPSRHFFGRKPDGRQKANARGYEIIRPWFTRQDAAGRDVLEALWKSRNTVVAQENTIAVVDISGSVYWCNQRPITMAVALGLYFAERYQGVFHNHMIAFSERPQLVKIHGRNLEEKLNYMRRSG